MKDPGYLDLADELERRLRSSRPGTRLPSENELAAAHGVNRQTARAAIQQLERRHLVVRFKGRGTFVIRRIAYVISAAEPPSFTETVARAGAEAESCLLRTERRSATPAESRGLELPVNAEVLVVHRRARVDRLPAIRSTSVLPSDLLPGLEEQLADGVSLFGLLSEQHGVVPRRARVHARLELAPHEVSSALGLDGRPPCWKVVSTNRDQASGRLVERSETWMRPDLFDVVLDLEDDGPTRAPAMAWPDRGTAAGPDPEGLP